MNNEKLYIECDRYDSYPNEDLNMLKRLILLAAVFSLSGCLATANLAEEDGVLSNGDRTILRGMLMQTQTTCTTHRYEEGSGRKITGDIKIHELPIAKKFYSSDNGWYKAHIVSQGAWDDVFYNPSIKRMVCGQMNWQTFKESKTITFKEVGVQEKSVLDVPVRKSSENSANTEQRLLYAKDLHERNLLTLSQYNNQVKLIMSGD